MVKELKSASHLADLHPEPGDSSMGHITGCPNRIVTPPQVTSFKPAQSNHLTPKQQCQLHSLSGTSVLQALQRLCTFLFVKQKPGPYWEPSSGCSCTDWKPVWFWTRTNWGILRLAVSTPWPKCTVLQGGAARLGPCRARTSSSQY